MKAPKILFVLPVRGGGGGAHSVVQEAVGLNRLGVSAQIAVDSPNYSHFISAYPELGELRFCVLQYKTLEDLGVIFTDFDVVVATTNGSVAEILQARKGMAQSGRSTKFAYYVQDYEPLFYATHTNEWKVAYDSYSLIPDAMLFAKTRWLQQIVYENHGINVAKVKPSIDHSVYYPNLSREMADPSVTAMLRPQTPRRAPRRTARVLSILADEFGDRISLHSFGVESDELSAFGIRLSPQVTNHGILRRPQVANLLRNSDMFLDLSDFQAFGRTGLESMACGCVPIVPVLGGTGEYAQNFKNSYVVDTRSDEQILSAVRSFVGLAREDRWTMRMNALATAADFTLHKAAVSELALFSKIMNAA